MSALSDDYIKNFSDERKGIFNKRFSDDYDPNESEEINIIRILNEMRELGLADGGRIGYKDGPSLLDIIDIQATGSKTGKQQIQGAPDGITIDKETFDAIIQADIPITQKIDFLASYQYGKGRDRIEKDNQELFLGEGGFKDRNIGLGFNKDGEGIGGTLMYNLETGEPEFKIGFKKEFNKGGRVAYQDGTPERKDYETPVTDVIKSVNEKSIDALEKGGELFNEYTGINKVYDFPGVKFSATGAPSDFRHQAASNALAKALGKGKFTDPILGPISYLSGGIGAFGLGTGKEIIDFFQGVADPNMTTKEAFDQSIEDSISNFKGAFAKDKTSEELYAELMKDYVPKNNFDMLPIRSRQMFLKQKQLQDAKTKDKVITPRKKPIKKVTGTTKPGTGGGGFDTSAADKAGTSLGSGQFSPKTSKGRSGYTLGGLARMLGE